MEEVEEDILQDLKTLGVQPDQVSAIYRQIYFVSIIFFFRFPSAATTSPPARR
jgi:flagellar biosynthesis regulator FlbT